MANHKSTKKRIRQNAVLKMSNALKHKTMRNALRDIRATTKKKEAAELESKVAAMIDKLVKHNIIHKNKGANLKSGMAKHVGGLK